MDFVSTWLAPTISGIIAGIFVFEYSVWKQNKPENKKINRSSAFRMFLPIVGALCIIYLVQDDIRSKLFIKSQTKEITQKNIELAELIKHKVQLKDSLENEIIKEKTKRFSATKFQPLANFSANQSNGSLVVKFNKKERIENTVSVFLYFTNHSNDECNISEIFFSDLKGAITPIPAFDPITRNKIEPFPLAGNKSIYLTCSFNLQTIINKHKSLAEEYGVDTCRIGIWARYPKDTIKTGRIIEKFIVSTQNDKINNIDSDISDRNQKDFYPK